MSGISHASLPKPKQFAIEMQIGGAARSAFEVGIFAELMLPDPARSLPLGGVLARIFAELTPLLGHRFSRMRRGS